MATAGAGERDAGGRGAEEPDISALRVVEVTVETVLLRASHNEVRFRTRTARLRDGEHPDRLARALAGLPDRYGHGLLHSTSWRFEDRGVVLSYAGLPDPDPAAATRPVNTTATVGSGDPLAPSPHRIRPVDVAAHACRHLAFLRHTDPVVAAATADAPDLWRLLTGFTPALAGLLDPSRATAGLAPWPVA